MTVHEESVPIGIDFVLSGYSKNKDSERPQKVTCKDV